MRYLPTYEELQKLSDAELMEKFNTKSENTVPYLDFYLNELARRENQREAQKNAVLNREMFELNKEMATMNKNMVSLTKNTFKVAIFALIVSILSAFVSIISAIPNLATMWKWFFG